MQGVFMVGRERSLELVEIGEGVGLEDISTGASLQVLTGGWPSNICNNYVIWFPHAFVCITCPINFLIFSVNIISFPVLEDGCLHMASLCWACVFGAR